MSTPVVAVSSAPTFGGLTGYKRPVLGKPTQVPTNLPAFRGRTNKPGSDVKTPAIQNSKNRQDRGTNVTIPYARICPIDHMCDLGRVSPGDVVFTSRTQVTSYHVSTQRQERVVGIDFLNKALGNDDATRPARSLIHPRWEVGNTVLLGGETNSNAPADDLLGNFMADNWREASFLRDWVCDGIVLSNDEPYAHTSNGNRDVQQFNICVQGLSAVNNGLQDYKGNGVEAYPRQQMETAGYKKEGTVAIGGRPYYQSYSLQMFDRKVKALSTLYVGLVATQREMTDEIKEALRKNSNVEIGSLDDKKLKPGNNYKTFYTFKFVCFSDRAATFSVPLAGGDRNRDPWMLAEPPGKKQRSVHHDDVADASTMSFDPYAPCSIADYRGMVGAWKIGKVMDTAARRRDQYNGGPVDTAEQLTVNVKLEWCDWRFLRRCTQRPDIGSYVSGATPWLGFDTSSSVDIDDKRVLRWPTQYSAYSTKNMEAAKRKRAAEENAPINPDRMNTMSEVFNAAQQPAKQFDLQTDAKQQFESYKDRVDDSALIPVLEMQRRIALVRSADKSPALSAEQFEALWASASEGAPRLNLGRFKQWLNGLKAGNKTEFAFIQAILGSDKVENANAWSKLGRKNKLYLARKVFAQMKYFRAVKDGNDSITKETFEKFIRSKENAGGEKLSDKEIADFAAALDKTMEYLIEFETELTGDTSMELGDVDDVTSGAAAGAGLAMTLTNAVPPAAGQKRKASTRTTATTSTASSSTATSSSAAKPSGKPAAKTVVSSASTSSIAQSMEAEPAATSAAAEGDVEAAPSNSAVQKPTGNVSRASPSAESSDIFSQIFGSSASAAINPDPDRSPSSGTAKSRVRRAREGR